MIKKIQTYIRQHELLSERGRVLVGLSGGADSVCLLYALRELGYDTIAAHCNFHLRDTESDRDEFFVENWCRQLGVRLVKTDFRTADYARENGISLEMAARDLRYAWFEQMRVAENCEAIAVAHHMNDQAETMLLNLKRGTGISGMAGMKPRNGHIIRPLLCLTRKQIEETVRAHGLTYVTDSTNSDTTIRRNAIRAILSESTEAEIGHMAHAAELLHAYDVLLGALLRGDAIPAECEHALLYELLSPYGLNSTQVSNILEALPGSGKRFETPSYTAEISHGELHIRANQPAEEEAQPMVLRSIRPRLKNEHFPAADASYALFDADKLPEQLSVRHWKEGDWFYPICNNGHAGKKKLQDFFSDRKLSLADKNSVWLLTAGDDIVWIIGHRVDDRYKVTEQTTRIAEIECSIMD